MLPASRVSPSYILRPPSQGGAIPRFAPTSVRPAGLAASAAVTLAALLLAAPARSLSIVDTGTPSLPPHTGHAVKPHRVSPSHPPQNPYLASNPGSNIHDDTWMTDAYRRPGPLGKSLVATSEAATPAVCGSLAFDKHGRIVTVCPSAGAGPQARIINPNTLATVSTYALPAAPDPPGTQTYQNFSGGGYFFLDNRDRLWVPTKTDHIFVLSEGSDGKTLTLQHDYDLTSKLDTSTERITSALPDFHGLIWFVSKANGKVGTLNTKTGALKVMRTGEEIENSFAVGRGGVYIVSDKRMYRFEADAHGRPTIVWQAGYRNSGIHKPSQVDAGSGTTPTIMDGGYVAITDNAAPKMDVVVYRTARRLHGKPRKVCQQPVFAKGRSATENSLITAGRSLIAENNYGYQDPFGLNSGAVTQPGFARVDVKRDGTGCRRVWTNHDARAPTVVPKLSTATGLIYTYTRPPDPDAQGYYWTAIDYRTGKTRWMQYAGSGLTFNNNYAGLALGPDGSAYLGVIGGMLKLSDG
ncbi:MAG: hypothetical protein QOI00_1686 [Chloroflexota bacterium]|nr:hypothetical protein [Chloroflexota bacterium]